MSVACSNAAAFISSRVDVTPMLIAEHFDVSTTRPLRDGVPVEPLALFTPHGRERCFANGCDGYPQTRNPIPGRKGVDVRVLRTEPVYCRLHIVTLPRKSETAELIEEAKAGLLRKLRALQPLALSDLAAVTEAQEEVLRRYLEEAIAGNCSRLFEGAEWNSIARRISLAGRHYELIVRESLPKQDTLEVWLLQRDLGARPRRPKPQTFQWHANGKYSKAALFVGAEVAADLTALADLVAAILATGYKWYEEQLHSLINDDRVTAVRMYSFLRTIVSDDGLLQRLWLVSADPDHGCYLVDERLAVAALSRVRPRAAEVGKSALRILSEFVTSTLPFEVTHSRAAVTIGQCIDVNLEESRYSNDKSLFMTGEIAFYGSPLISIFPIVRTGRSYLLAVFPTQDRAYLEPILAAHRLELEAEFGRFRNSLTRLLSALKMRPKGLLNAQVGDFTGGLIGGIVKSLGQ